MDETPSNYNLHNGRVDLQKIREMPSAKGLKNFRGPKILISESTTENPTTANDNA